MITREEIERAAKEYAEKEVVMGSAYIYPTHRRFVEAKAESFKAGAELVDKYWQEKTKYKSLSDELPKEGEPVIFKFTKNVQKVYCRLGCVALGFILLDDGDSLSQREAKELGAFWKKLE